MIERYSNAFPGEIGTWVLWLQKHLKGTKLVTEVNC